MRLSTEGMAKEIQQLKSENTTLQFENLQMREALEKIRIISSICSDRPNWKSFDEISLLTKEAIKNTPHINQLAKQREADLNLINLALQRKMLEGAPEFEKQWNIAIANRELVYGKTNERGA